MAKHWSMLNGQGDVVGLDIDERVISATRLQRGRDGVLDVRNAGCVARPLGNTPQAVAHAIRSLWRQTQMPTNTVCSCLRSPSLLVRSFRHPPMADAEIKAALRLEAEEELQMPAEQLYVDWHIFCHGEKKSDASAEAKVEGFLVAVPKTEAQRHVELLEAAGLVPVILDVGCTAIANLYLTLHGLAHPEDVVCLVNLLEHGADLSIVCGNKCLYPRSLFSPASTWETALEQLAEHIRDELKYFQFKLHQQAVQKVVFMGTASSPEELVRQIRQRLPVPVEYWDPLQDPHLHLPATVQHLSRDAGHPALSVVSLGLALRAG